MATHKRLGIYWGETGLTLVETGQAAFHLATFVPFDGGPDQPDTPKMPGVSQDLRILETLQKAIRNAGFSTSSTYVALPSKDILIRSFLIPWMKSSEIHGAVAFEVKKYIPFSIEEMAYTYFPTTVNQNNVRQIGIIFVAIRKNVLTKYTNIFVQSGLNVVYSEPAAMSLLRVLMQKRFVHENQNTAILTFTGNAGELSIASRGHIKFYRDFKISINNTSPSLGESIDEIRARIFNEVRVSFEFFSRQHSELSIDKLLTISSGQDPSFWKGLTEEAGVPVESIESSKLFTVNGVSDIEGASALGATMSGDVFSVIDFNLFEDASTQVSLKKAEILQKNKQLILPILAGVGAALMIGLIVYLSGIFLNGIRSQIDVLTTSLGKNAEMPLVDIEAMINAEKKKLEALRSLPSSSRALPLIVRFIKRMPKEMTISSLQLTIVDQDGASGRRGKRQIESQYMPVKSVFSLSLGVALHISDTNVAFNKANQFINTLRQDNLFSSRFSRITASSLTTQGADKDKVTVFNISCEGK